MFLVGCVKQRRHNQAITVSCTGIDDLEIASHVGSTYLSKRGVSDSCGLNSTFQRWERQRDALRSLWSCRSNDPFTVNQTESKRITFEL